MLLPGMQLYLDYDKLYMFPTECKILELNGTFYQVDIQIFYSPFILESISP